MIVSANPARTSQPRVASTRSWERMNSVSSNFTRWLRRGRTPRQRLGDLGERLAVRHLRALGFRVAAKNVRVPIGHSPSGRAVIGEIDIVAYEGETLVFIEVKTRRRDGMFATERSVDARKRRLLARSARRYRRWFGVASDPYRFDVVTVLAPRKGTPRVRLLRGGFADPLLR